MKKLKLITLFLCCLLFKSCSTTIVYTPKYIFIEKSKDIKVIQKGSELKDNSASQTSDGTFTLKIP